MNWKIKKAAVLGAGAMGSAIAAHLANVGIPSFLLDIVPPEMTEAEKKKRLTFESPEVRNRFAVQGKNRIQESRPASAPASAGLRVFRLRFQCGWLGESECSRGL